jgi:hypothetical protein
MDAKVWRDRLRILAPDVELLSGWLIAILEVRNGRQGQLVGDARIVNRQRCGKEPVTDDTMRIGGLKTSK